MSPQPQPHPLPRDPSGWFAVGLSRDLASGSVRTIEVWNPIRQRTNPVVVEAQ